MTRIKWDMNINLQHLVMGVLTIMATVMITAFNFKSKVDMHDRDIQDLKAIEKKVDDMMEIIIEIKLDLKDKADREDG